MKVKANACTIQKKKCNFFMRQSKYKDFRVKYAPFLCRLNQIEGFLELTSLIGQLWIELLLSNMIAPSNYIGYLPQKFCAKETKCFQIAT